MTSMSVNQAKARIIVGLEEKLGGLRKLAILGLTLGALVLLAGCSGKTTGATDITHVSAKLHATGRCSAGQTCTWYWEYWPAHLPRYFGSHQVSQETPVQGPVHGASANVPLSTVITGLAPGETYRWVFCGSPNNGDDYACVGPHGQGGSTTADPPPDSETFFTAPFEGLAEGWDGTEWAVQTTPIPTGASGDSDLSGISCASATACTAVGTYPKSGRDVTLAEHWDGSSWTVQSTPNPNGAESSHLNDVSCTSATACTAVGSYTSYVGTIGRQFALAERWDGTAWTIQPTPDLPGPYGYSMEGVSCTSATACTAVGYYRNSAGKLVTLAERWDGSSWTVQSTPNPDGAESSHLNDVSCTSATACTAVGSYTSGGVATVTLAERWNGTSWKIQPTPNPAGAGGSYMEGVSCTTATACTAVGSYYNSAGKQVTLAERRNGTSWTVQTTANPAGAGGSYMEGVACTSATACTAVGYSDEDLRLPPVTLAERWNGTSWTVQSTPNPIGGQSHSRRLEGVSCTTATTCTAVGHN